MALAHVLLIGTLCAAPVAPAEDELASELVRLDELVTRRDDPAALADLDKGLSAALAAHPRDYRVLWRASRFKSWLADGETDSERLQQVAHEGWQLGERAVAANPEGVEGYFFMALGIASWGQASGMWSALTHGVGGKYEAAMKKVLALDTTLSSGMPLVAMGKYYASIPWPLRDRKKAAEFYRQALQKHPQNLRAHLWLAEVLSESDDVAGAREHLAAVANGAVEYDPPEARRVKERAAKLSAALPAK